MHKEETSKLKVTVKSNLKRILEKKIIFTMQSMQSTLQGKFFSISKGNHFLFIHRETGKIASAIS